MSNPYKTAFERLRVPDEIPVEGESEEDVKDLSDEDFDDEPEDLEKAEDDDPCWDGYEQVGMKKKNGREVPNCVPMQKSLIQFGGALYSPAIANGELVLVRDRNA